MDYACALAEAAGEGVVLDGFEEAFGFEVVDDALAGRRSGRGRRKASRRG